mmetsp:Transcript_33530/g.117524  ORF Transcript_33530/g.117524 Transcript_33530/m.117524 type:complete len:104 (-) Transcript_33530:291-602(-)
MPSRGTVGLGSGPGAVSSRRLEWPSRGRLSTQKIAVETGVVSEGPVETGPFSAGLFRGTVRRRYQGRRFQSGAVSKRRFSTGPRLRGPFLGFAGPFFRPSDRV